jgi:hypothetical protein
VNYWRQDTKRKGISLNRMNIYRLKYRYNINMNFLFRLPPFGFLIPLSRFGFSENDKISFNVLSTINSSCRKHFTLCQGNCLFFSFVSPPDGIVKTSD